MRFDAMSDIIAQVSDAAVSTTSSPGPVLSVLGSFSSAYIQTLFHRTTPLLSRESHSRATREGVYELNRRCDCVNCGRSRHSCSFDHDGYAQAPQPEAARAIRARVRARGQQRRRRVKSRAGAAVPAEAPREVQDPELVANRPVEFPLSLE